MTSSAKRKGDRAERDAVRLLVDRVPDLLVPNPSRMLGAGRRDDVGDLRVFPDCAVQVRSLAELGKAIRTSALDAASQAANAGWQLSMGMVPIPRSRTELRWLACCVALPFESRAPAVTFGGPTRAVAALRDGPKGMVAQVVHGTSEPIFVCSIDTWLESYRHRRACALAGTAAR